MRTAVYTVSEEKCVKLCLPQFRKKSPPYILWEIAPSREMVRGFPTTKVRGETHRACPFVSVLCLCSCERVPEARRALSEKRIEEANRGSKPSRLSMDQPTNRIEEVEIEKRHKTKDSNSMDRVAMLPEYPRPLAHASPRYCSSSQDAAIFVAPVDDLSPLLVGESTVHS